MDKEEQLKQIKEHLDYLYEISEVYINEKGFNFFVTFHEHKIVNEIIWKNKEENQMKSLTEELEDIIKKNNGRGV